MKSTLTRNVALAATAMGVVLATPALAQEASGTSESDIIVTARRMDERLQDVPISITVYSPEQLADRNIVNSTDLAAYTPSLAVNGRYGPDKSSFVIRGFSQDLNTAPTVGVYFADAVAPRLSSNITSGNGAGVGAMFDLQNVQVLKGPQGTLFGRNTTGGAILLVPQKPTDKLEGYVEGTVGNFNQWRIQGVINIPLSDSIRFRAGVDRNQREGYLINKTGIGPTDFNDVNYWAARASLTIDVTPDLENYTVFTYSDSDTNGYLGKYAYCNRGTIPGSDGNVGTPVATGARAANCAEIDRQNAARYGFYDVSNNNTTPFVRGEVWQVINTTTWKASDTLTVKNIFSYGISKESYSFNLQGENTPRPFVITNPGPNEGQGNQWTLTEELQFQGRTSDDSLVWQVGGYLEHSEPNGLQTQYTAIISDCKSPQQTYSFTCSGSSIGIAHNMYYFKNYGLYAQATYKFTDQFSLTAGIRNTWDKQREDADNITVIPGPAGPTAYRCSRAVTPTPNPGAALLTSGACGIGRSFSIESSEPTWLINLDYKPNQDILVYAKYARGYRGGGINEANQRFETWNPEFVDNYELGLKTSFSGESVRGTFNLAGYWNEFKDQQVSVFIPQCITGSRPDCTMGAPTGVNGIQNVGKSRLRGVEADGSLLIGDSWRFDFGYAYNDSKVTDGGSRVPNCNNAAFNCAQAVFLTKGTILPFAPKNRITMTANYTLPIPEEVGTVTLGATFTHTDKYFSNHGSDRAFAQGAIPYNAGISPATDLLNLNLNWNTVGGSPIDFALFMTNVTGEKYWVSSANSLTSTGADWIILGEPRMYGLRVKVHFGN